MFYREKLKGIRKIKKITQTELGVALGKSQEIVGYWEQGRRKPCDSDIRMMATYLNIPVQEISDLSEFKKNKHTGDIDLLDLKLTELDNLLEEYGDLPAEITYKIVDLKDSLIKCHSTNTRLKNKIARYDTMVNNTITVLYSKDINFEYVFVNESFLNLVSEKYNNENIIGMKSLSLFTFDDYNEVLEAERIAFNRKERVKDKTVAIPGTRGKRMGKLTIIPIMEKSKVIEIRCSIRDITSTYKLEKTREELEVAINHIDQLVWIGHRENPNELNSALKKTFLNQRYRDIIPEVGTDDRLEWNNIVHEDDRNRLEEWYLHEQYPKKITFRAWIDNEIHWFEDEAFRKGNLFFGIIADITEKVERMTEQGYLFKCLNSVDSMFWISRLVDSQNNKFEYISASGAVKKIYGLSEKQLMKNDNVWVSMLHPDNKELSSAWVNDYSFPLTIEYKIIVNGKTKWIEDSIHNKDDLYFGLTRDITERKEKTMKQEYLFKCLNSVDSMFWIARLVDSQNNKFEYISASGAVKKIYGLSEKQFMKNDNVWRKMLHPDNKELSNAGVDSYSFPLTIEYKIIVNGKTKWIEDSIHNKDDLYFGLTRDITEKKEKKRFLKKVKKS